jgi:hypothetical protein
MVRTKKTLRERENRGPPGKQPRNAVRHIPVHLTEKREGRNGPLVIYHPDATREKMEALPAGLGGVSPAFVLRRVQKEVDATSARIHENYLLITESFLRDLGTEISQPEVESVDVCVARAVWTHLEANTQALLTQPDTPEEVYTNLPAGEVVPTPPPSSDSEDESYAGSSSESESSTESESESDSGPGPVSETEETRAESWNYMIAIALRNCSRTWITTETLLSEFAGTFPELTETTPGWEAKVDGALRANTEGKWHFDRNNWCLKTGRSEVWNRLIEDVLTRSPSPFMATEDILRAVGKKAVTPISARAAPAEFQRAVVRQLLANTDGLWGRKARRLDSGISLKHYYLNRRVESSAASSAAPAAPAAPADIEVHVPGNVATWSDCIKGVLGDKDGMTSAQVADAIGDAYPIFVSTKIGDWRRSVMAVLPKNHEGLWERVQRKSADTGRLVWSYSLTKKKRTAPQQQQQQQRKRAKPAPSNTVLSRELEHLKEDSDSLRARDATYAEYFEEQLNVARQYHS